MRHVLRVLGIAGALTALMMLVGAPAAFGHAQRQVGPIHLEIGFGTEPAYVGQPNSGQIILTEHGAPVVDLGDTLKVQVAFGGQQETLPLEPNFEVGGDGEPGDYRAWFIPSQPGPYTFQLSGSVHGMKIHLAITSGATTFEEVQSPSEAMFPAVDAPSTQQLSERIQQDSARLTEATATVATAKNAADDAKTIAVIGVIVGCIGIAVAIVAVVSSRRKAATTG
jgi:hypothetical protein